MSNSSKDPGLGYNSFQNAKSFFKNDGSSNIIHENKKRGFDDLYSYLIKIPWVHFFVLVVFQYTLLNIIFGVVYFLIGIDQITDPTGIWWRDLLNGFFFSAQTLTTVGYGGIAPSGLVANIIAAFEAMIGLLSFSFITGLLYGRFSKPKAAVKFSENIIVREFKGGRALMFRLMNARKTIMVEPEITVTLSITEKNNGAYRRAFHKLELEIDKITYLPTMWTIVHQLEGESPLQQYSNEELKLLDGELYILLKYYDDSFSQQLFRIYSYKFDKLITDVKFEPSLRYDKDGYVVLDHDKINQINSF